MGVGIFSVYAPQLENAAFNSDGKLLASNLPVLDALCVELNLPQLSSFTDDREPPAGFDFSADTDPDELEMLMGEWDEWFEPESALPTVEGLVMALASASAKGLTARDAKDLAEDLGDIRNDLRLATLAGSKFRLDLF